jgi:hypothetical protein
LHSGVGQFAASFTTTVVRDSCEPFMPRERSWKPCRTSEAIGDGQDEDPLALVRCADFSRAEYSPRRFVTDCSQLSNDFSESEGDVSFDIFKEAELGSKKSNSVCDKWPEVARVVCAEALSGCGEGLAGIAPSEDVHAVTKLCPWEGFKIRPYRCCVHESRFHF